MIAPLILLGASCAAAGYHARPLIDHARQHGLDDLVASARLEAVDAVHRIRARAHDNRR